MGGYFRLLGFFVGLFVFDFVVMRRFISFMLDEKITSHWRWLVYLLLFLLFINPILRVAFHQDPRPSPVNASFISQLIPEQIEPERIMKALDSLEDRDKVWSFERDDMPRQANWMLSYRFFYGYAFNTVSIRINFYWSEQQLIDRLPRRRSQHARRESTVLTNENNTQAFLHASFMPRSHGFAVDHRFIWTELRLGNVYIDMSEQRDHRDLYPNASTDFIRLLYELLTAEE